MTWLQRHRLRRYLAGAAWIVPALGMILAFLAVHCLHVIESMTGLQSQFDPSATLTFPRTLAASMFTLIVFVCSAPLITVQLSSARLTPRIRGLVPQSRATIPKHEEHGGPL